MVVPPRCFLPCQRKPELDSVGRFIALISKAFRNRADIIVIQLVQALRSPIKDQRLIILILLGDVSHIETYIFIAFPRARAMRTEIPTSRRPVIVHDNIHTSSNA